RDPEFMSSVRQRDATASLRVVCRDSSEKWVVVSTPGDRWYSLATDRGFMLDHADEGTPADEVRRILTRLIEIGVAYLQGDCEIVRSRRLGLPILVVRTAHERVEINQSIDATVRHVFRPRHHP